MVKKDLYNDLWIDAFLWTQRCGFKEKKKSVTSPCKCWSYLTSLWETITIWKGLMYDWFHKHCLTKETTLVCVLECFNIIVRCTLKMIVSLIQFDWHSILLFVNSSILNSINVMCNFLLQKLGAVSSERQLFVFCNPYHGNYSWHCCIDKTINQLHHFNILYMQIRDSKISHPKCVNECYVLVGWPKWLWNAL